MVAAPVQYGVVPRSWPGEAVVILGSGPSLTQEDVASCQGRARVIAIKDTVALAPWADVLYSGDEMWWRRCGPSVTFTGARYALVVPGDASQERDATAAGATLLKYSGLPGISGSPDTLRSGSHSGYQAIQLAVHFGAAKIVLLGYDMQASEDGRDHFFGSHAYAKKPTPYQYLPAFETMLSPLWVLGVTVVNATRRTALKAFPQMPLSEALA